MCDILKCEHMLSQKKTTLHDLNGTTSLQMIWTDWDGDTSHIQNSYVESKLGHFTYKISWYLWTYNILQPPNWTFQNHNILNYSPKFEK